jgi:Tol biopolymer transport system component
MFMSTRDDGTTTELYSMFADGSGQTRLTNNTLDDYGPELSPDGTLIAFDRGGARLK